MSSEAANSSKDYYGDPPQLLYEVPSSSGIQRTDKEPKLPLDILLLTVKDDEFLACYQQLKNPCRCWFDDFGYVYFEEEDESQKEKVKIALLKCDGGSGGPGGSLISVKNAVTVLRPKAVISVGACSGLNPAKTKLGDVIVSSRLSTYASKVVMSDQEQSTGLRTYVSKHFLNVIKNCADGWQAPLKNPEASQAVEVHFGEILSGLEQIEAECRRDQLAKCNLMAMAVEMEGEGVCHLLGVFTAAFDSGIEWLIVKGIADYADSSCAKQNAKSWCQCASVMAASLVMHILSNPTVFCSLPHYKERVPAIKRSAECVEVEGSVKSLKSDVADVQLRLTQVEEKQSSAEPQISPDFANCVSDITNNANLLHENTRQWFFEKFDKWFSGPDSRAFVLLGDAGVGKSVIAGALAQRKRDAGELGCAFFCRNREEGRNDPRKVIGTIARDLCKCINEYSKIVGGEKGVANFLKDKEIGVPDLFTKLLEEPLAQCKPPPKRLLVIIDALDETKCESREDFLPVITKGLPRLPDWLVFSITSRPDDQILNTLATNKSSIKICKGGISQKSSFYQQHEQDIQRFLEEKVDFSRLPISVEEATKNCSGLFLCAFFTAEKLTDTNNSVEVNNMSELNDLISGGIDHFFEENFCRVQKLLGTCLFKKLFGCMVAAPSPLPESFITFILEREKSHLKERDVLNAVSQFVDQRTSDHTVTFLHNLIPGWLENKKKNRNFFIDPSIAAEYLRNVLTEILNAAVSQPPHRLSAMGIADDLQTYVLHFAVRYLCKLADEDSLRQVYRFLTCYTFLIKRIQLSGPEDLEECADLSNDLKLAASCFTTPKQSILEEIGDTILSHAWALQGYPNVLKFCLQITSDAVRENLWPSSCLALRSVQSEYDIGSATSFAVSSDKKLIAIGLTDRRLLFVKTATEKTCGFFQLSPDIIDHIQELLFSPLDKFLFFGRIDKWFSIEDGCVKELAQFQRNSVEYPYAAMVEDGKYLMTYRGRYNLCYDIPCEHKRCLTDLLAQWALLELDHIDDMTCTFTGLSDTVSNIEISLGNPTSELLRFLQIDSTLFKLCTDPLPYDPALCFCCRRLTELIKSDIYKMSSLIAVRQLVLELYPHLFANQIWNFDSGKPFLYDWWSQGSECVTFDTYNSQLPEAYLQLLHCHGYMKSWSVSNFAVINAVYSLVMVSNLSSVNGSDSGEESINEGGNNPEQGGIEEFD